MVHWTFRQRQSLSRMESHVPNSNLDRWSPITSKIPRRAIREISQILSVDIYSVDLLAAFPVAREADRRAIW